MWTHQNGLVWGWLQTLGVVQAGVVAGWYATYCPHKYNYAVGITGIGLILSIALCLLVEGDIARRHEIRQAIEKLDLDFLPKGQHDGISGREIIMWISPRRAG